MTPTTSTISTQFPHQSSRLSSIDELIQRALSDPFEYSILGTQQTAIPMDAAAIAFYGKCGAGSEIHIGGMRGVVYGQSQDINSLPWRIERGDLIQTEHGADLPHSIIVSVYPEPCLFRTLHYGFKDYYLPGAPRGEFRALRIYDSFTIDRQVENADTPKPREERRAVKVPHDLIAREALRHYAGDLRDPAGYGIGIIVARGLLPSPEELQFLVDRQTRCFANRIRMGDQLHARREYKEIDDYHYVALDWIQDYDLLKHPWGRITKTSSRMKECLACGATMDVQRVVCRVCHTHLDEFVIERNLEVPVDDPFLRRAVDGLLKSRNILTYQHVANGPIGRDATAAAPDVEGEDIGEELIPGESAAPVSEPVPEPRTLNMDDLAQEDESIVAGDPFPHPATQARGRTKRNRYD